MKFILVAFFGALVVSTMAQEGVGGPVDQAGGPGNQQGGSENQQGPGNQCIL